jgi:hypothetical protein
MGNTASTKFISNKTTVSNWMEQLSNELQDRNLKEIVIPGSHDSGCYRMSSRVGAPWTLCQSLSIFDQLHCGVRYFDLRFGYFKQGDEFWIMHHAWSSRVNLFEVLESLVNFLELHTKEIVILQFSHFKYFNDNVHRKFKDRLENRLGKWIVDSSSAFTSKLSEMWKLDKRVVIVSECTMFPEFCPVSTLPSIWHNKADVDKLKIGLDLEVEQKHESAWILQAILSPKQHRPWSVKALAELVNPHVMKWLKEWNTDNLNIVIIDYVTSPEFAEIIIDINKKRHSTIANVIDKVQQKAESVVESVAEKLENVVAASQESDINEQIA